MKKQRSAAEGKANGLRDLKKNKSFWDFIWYFA